MNTLFVLLFNNMNASKALSIRDGDFKMHSEHTLLTPFLAVNCKKKRFSVKEANQNFMTSFIQILIIQFLQVSD